MRYKICGGVEYYSQKRRKKGKAIPVTGRGGPQDCETSRVLHILDNRLTNSGEVVSFSAGRSFLPRKIPGTHFC
jgi:hypothetical protein